MIDFLAYHFSAVIIFIALLHLAFFLWLLGERKRRQMELKAFLQNIVRGFSNQSDIDPNVSVDDQISRYVKDWEEVLDATPADQRARPGDRDFLRRCDIKDEKRPYLETGLETKYNVARTAIEAYPILGILGTLLAMAFALGSGGTEGAMAASDAAAGPVAAGDISAIIDAFKSAIWSTVWGLSFALGFMLFNAAVENGFEHLKEHRTHVQAAVQKTKQLRLSNDSQGEK